MPENLDPYTYPGTDVLRNLKDIRDRTALDTYEANATWARLIQIQGSPPSGRCDVAHLKAIHHRIFQDVYAWAGSFRTVDMSKGGSFFARPDFIATSLDELLRRLYREDGLREPARFMERAGYYLAELNAIHPFREGNGRTQREFLRRIALQAGHSLDWRKVSRQQMIDASRESFSSGQPASLVKVIELCLA